MDVGQKLNAYWFDIVAQNAQALSEHFLPDAYIRWVNTNEQFNVQEFIIANCEYPGEWMGEVERLETLQDAAVTVTRIWLADNSISFHVTSFFQFRGDRIAALDEYWGEDGAPPQWRLDKQIGKPIIREKPLHN